MHKDILEIESKIDNYDLTFVYEKMKGELNISRLEFDELEKEFKKFIKLIISENGPLAMINKRIDEVWHTFILFSPLYRSFCMETVGFYIDHLPRTPLTPVHPSAINNFLIAYKNKYTVIPNIWLDDIKSIFNIENDIINMPLELNYEWSGWPGKK